MDLEQMIAVAKGERKANLVLKNARVVNVFTGEIYKADVAIDQGFIAGVGSYKSGPSIDLKGRYLCPGFIDGHVHIDFILSGTGTSYTCRSDYNYAQIDADEPGVDRIVSVALAAFLSGKPVRVKVSGGEGSSCKLTELQVGNSFD